MAGYTPVFGSVFTGTLHGRWPDVGLWVCILALADKNGELDMTCAYIASVTGLEERQVADCMVRFCEPDPASRSQESDGARLVLVDPPRQWGWRIVNHGKYRERARLLAKNSEATESGRDAERKRAARDKSRPPMSAGVHPCPPVSPDVRLSDSDADAYTDSKKEAKKTAAKAAPSKVGRVTKARTQIPEGRWLTDADRAFALERCPDMNVDATFDDFHNHHTAKGTLGADWHAGWRTWIGNCAKGFAYVRRPRRDVEAAQPILTPQQWREQQAAKRTQTG